jgi:protein arginine kinase activator
MNMLCEKCHQKQATVHMQQIVNGIKTEMHLCQDCSSQMDAPISIEALLNGLLGSFLSVAADKQSSQQSHARYEPCPSCGMTYDGFKSGGGKLGCAECYRVFSRELETILKSVQASTKHEGKYPQKSGRALFQKREALRLRGLMRQAIEEENFEEAARLRDEARSLESMQTEEL